MDAEYARIWVQTPPPPFQDQDVLIQHPPPAHEQEKVASDDLLLMGMMLWMEQGLVLEWLHPAKEKATEEQEDKEGNPCGHSHD